MKRTALLVFVLSLLSVAKAQHLDFMGYPMGVCITDFAKNVRQRYSLERRVGGDDYYIFKGPIYGHNLFFKADYSHKSRTVYRVTVTPQHIDLNAFVDSITVHHGTAEEVKGGYKWQKPEGSIFLYTPEGYDPTLIFLDAEAAKTCLEEKK